MNCNFVIDQVSMIENPVEKNTKRMTKGNMFVLRHNRGVIVFNVQHDEVLTLRVQE